MTDNKARRVRQVKSIEDDGSYSIAQNIWRDDPSGTHMLVPVEVWERVVEKARRWDEGVERINILTGKRIGGEDE